MKYELRPQYAFCGFKNLPYVLADRERAEYIFLDQDDFSFLFRCAAHREILPEELSDREQKQLQFLLKAEILREAAPDTPFKLPDYQSYPNHVRTEVQWSITGKCNFKCKHCFQSAPHALFGEPSLEQCLDIIAQMKACGILSVGITGGEPLIRKDFWDIIDALIAADIKIGTIYSNGWLINEALLDEFDKRHIHPAWQISFDGIGAHDDLRGVPGAEQKAIEAIKLLISRDYKVGTAYSIYKGNTDCFIETAKLLGELGVAYIKTGYTSPQGEYADHPELHLTPAEELAWYKKTIPAYLKAGRPIDIQCEGLFFGYSDRSIEEEKKARESELTRLKADTSCADCACCPKEALAEGEEPRLYSFALNDRFKDEEIACKRDVCGVLRSSFYISPKGHILPCMSLDGLPAGDAFPNLFETPLQQILTDSWYITATDFRIRDYWDHNKECKTCEHRLKCLAGCRAMALLNNDPNYLTLDGRTCMIVKEDWSGQIQKEIDKIE